MKHVGHTIAKEPCVKIEDLDHVEIIMIGRHKRDLSQVLLCRIVSDAHTGTQSTELVVCHCSPLKL